MHLSVISTNEEGTTRPAVPNSWDDLLSEDEGVTFTNERLDVCVSVS